MLLFAYLYYWNETKSPQMTNIFLIKQLKIGNTTFENDLNVMSVWMDWMVGQKKNSCT